jgi:hypothetical protein
MLAAVRKVDARAAATEGSGQDTVTHNRHSYVYQQKGTLTRIVTLDSATAMAVGQPAVSHSHRQTGLLVNRCAKLRCAREDCLSCC